MTGTADESEISLEIRTNAMSTGTYGLKGHWGLKGHFCKKSIVAIFGDSLMMGAIYMSSWVIGIMFS